MPLLIKRPLLAATLEDDPQQFANLQMPLLWSEKKDGIRGITNGSGICSRKFKPIPNLFLQKTFRDFPPGLEGELVKIKANGESIEDCAFDGEDGTESAVMSVDGRFTFFFYVFDYVSKSKFIPYLIRHREMVDRFSHHDFVQVLDQQWVNCSDDIRKALDESMHYGNEGIVLRKADGFYKFGRSTLSEALLIKFKPWLDDEAKIVGFTEKNRNLNAQTRDKLGYATRSKEFANLQKAGTLGALKCHHPKFGEFEIGSGFTAEFAQRIWDNQKIYMNLWFTFRFRGFTTYGKPKHASFVRFRPSLHHA